MGALIPSLYEKSSYGNLSLLTKTLVIVKGVDASLYRHICRVTYCIWTRIMYGHADVVESAGII